MTERAKLTQFLDDRRDTALNRPGVSDTLLVGRFHAYARMRLLPFLSVRTFAFIVRFVELTMLAEAFGRRTAIGLFSLQLVFEAVLGTWWGALEPMRANLREALDPPRRFRIVSLWYSRAFVLAPAAMLIALAVGVSQIEQQIPLAFTYLFVRALMLAFDVILRTAHSGIFAYSRVHRAGWSLYLPEIILPVVVLTTKSFIGSWSFVLAAVLHGAISRGLVLYFVMRAYRFHRQHWPELSWAALREVPPAQERREALAGAGAGVLTRAIEITTVGSAMTGIFSSGSDFLKPLLWFVVLSFPLLRAVSGWPMLFYQDLIYLDTAESRVLYNRLARKLPLVAIAVAVIMSILAFIGYRVAFGNLFLPFLGTLSLCFLGLSLLSAAQLVDFVRGRMLASGISAAAMITAVFLVQRIPGVTVRYVFILIALTPFVALGVRTITLLLPYRRRVLASSYGDFFAQIQALTGPQVVGAFRVFDTNRRYERLLTQWLLRHTSAVWLSNDRIHFAYPAKADRSRLATGILRRTAGKISDFTLDKRLSTPREEMSFETARAAFTSMFPEHGIVFDVRTGKRSGSQLPLDPYVVRRLWNAAIAYSRGQSSRRPPLLVDPVVEGGAVVGLFVLPRGKGYIKRWRKKDSAHFGK